MLASEISISPDATMAAAGDVAPDYQVQAVMSSVAPMIWSLVEPFIERARKASPDFIASRELADDILAKIQAKRYQLWLIHKDSTLSAVSVTSIEEMSRGSVCVVQYQGGDDLDGWLDIFKDAIKGWAAENGCFQVQLVGRPGWERKLKSRGLKKAFTIYVADL